MNIRRNNSEVPTLNITPLIDVVFILLVFFMLATNFARYRLINVETPQETQVQRTAEGAIVIMLLPDDEFLFDGNPVEEEALPSKVSEVIAIDPGRPFLIRPAPGVTLQEAIDAYDMARAAGAAAVSFSPHESGSGGAQ